MRFHKAREYVCTQPSIPPVQYEWIKKGTSAQSAARGKEGGGRCRSIASPGWKAQERRITHTKEQSTHQPPSASTPVEYRSSGNRGWHT